MDPDDSTISSLREALRVSPDNVPLRLHLADSLLAMKRPAEAEPEYRIALKGDAGSVSIKCRLAQAFFDQEKFSHAQVIVEELLKLPDTPAEARVLQVRLLLRDGEVDRAVRQYKQAVEDDPDLADLSLEARLGIDADELTSEVLDGRVRAAHESPESAPEFDVERPSTTFADVGGMEAVKDEIRMKIIHPLEQPELFKAYGKPIGGGILMYGPPGCGKTHMARATAGEVKAAFLSVGLNDVLEMWIGQSERNLHELFELARSRTPCVLFFDEVDALGASRTDMKQSAGRQLINQFLAELDGVDSSNEGVLVLAATNAPWHLDSAFRRPGRFDRIIFVPPPDEPARAEILRVILEGKPVRDVDFAKIASKTDRCSGADLKALVDITIEAKLREAMQRGVPSPITTRDLLAAVKQLKPTTKEWLSTARNYALYSNQGGLYDDILSYMKLA